MTLNEVCNPIINEWKKTADEQPTAEAFVEIVYKLQVALDQHGFRLAPIVYQMDEVGIVIDFNPKV
jgi:hypothetical protein